MRIALFQNLNRSQVVKPLVFTYFVLLNFVLTHSFILADILSDRLDQARTSTDAESFVDNILNFSIGVGVISLVGLCVYGGYKLLGSQGNPEAIAEGREIIVNALMGFILIGLSVAVLLLIQDTFNLPINP